MVTLTHHIVKISVEFCLQGITCLCQ